LRFREADRCADSNSPTVFPFFPLLFSPCFFSSSFRILLSSSFVMVANRGDAPRSNARARVSASKALVFFLPSFRLPPSPPTFSSHPFLIPSATLGRRAQNTRQIPSGMCNLIFLFFLFPPPFSFALVYRNHKTT